MRGRRDSVRGWAALWLIIALGWGFSAAAEELKIRVQPGETLRDIAAQHLGDPDMWTEILRVNGLTSVTQVKPGTELVIPAAEVTRADRALRSALEQIQRATEEGARLFATAEIEEGLRLYEEGVAKRKASNWSEATRLAGEAEAKGAEAMKLALTQRDISAEARLTDRNGSVEGRKPQDLVWTDRPLDVVLIEEEKVRTLSRSSAQITFTDQSRLRLNANSQAVIQRMRVDPLSRHEEAKVSLVEGDLYALLSGKSERKQFEVEVAEVSTEVDSRDFWVRRDDSGAKFTNYDDGRLDVTAKGETVTLGRNEGTLVRTGQAPSDKIAVLPAAELQAPADDSQSLEARVTLSWTAVPDATGYWLELAQDPAFARMVASRWGVTSPAFEAGPLDIGTYYWRVAALDKFGLPGERSQSRRFHIRVDRTPPYLILQEPGGTEIIRTRGVRLKGETEPGVTLLLDGAPVPVAADGRFEAEFEAKPGTNSFMLQATDGAGNVSRREGSFYFMPDATAALLFDENIPQLQPRHFLTAGEAISLSGKTEPRVQLMVRGPDGQLRASAYADGEGRFAFNLPLAAATEEFDVDAVQPSGFATRDRFAVSQDREPPQIQLEGALPKVTAVEWLALRGRADGAVAVTVNGRPVRLIEDAFDETVTLQQGRNQIELTAVDAVGNLRVERFDTSLDQKPPELLGYEVSPRQARSGEPVRIEVRARDESGLRKAAPVRIQVAGTEYAEFLQLSGATGTYQSTMVLPPEAVGRVTVKDVEIEDYAGNKVRLGLDQ